MVYSFPFGWMLAYPTNQNRNSRVSAGITAQVKIATTIIV
jgi:hypothetical protein